MTAVERIAHASARLAGITAEITLAKGRELELSTWMIAHLQQAVQACVDEPVFRQAIADCRQAAIDYLSEIEPMPKAQPQAAQPEAAPRRQECDCPADKCLAQSPERCKWEQPAPQAEPAAPMKPLRLSREQIDKIFDAHQEAPTLQFRYLIADAILAELNRKRCGQVNSGTPCDMTRAPGERRCPDCNPGAPK